MVPAASPLAELLAIAGPTVATMASYTLMTFTDKWLVSRLGPVFVGAQGNGGLAAWAPQAMMYGTLQIINTYVSQNMGAGRRDRAAAYVWNGIWLAIIYSLLLQPYALLLPKIFALAEVDARQSILAAQYGRVLIYGCGLNMATRALSQFFYGTHQARVVMAAGIIANVVNLFLAAVLVFGNGPIPEGLGMFGRVVGALGHWTNIAPMGIVGSAWGTVIATLVELAIPLVVFLSPKINAQYATRHACSWSWSHIRDIVRLGWHGGAMFANEMVCWGFFMVYLVSHFGKAHASAGWIAHQYMSLSFMPAVGISVATTALVGKYIGMGRHDLAEHRFWLSLKFAAGYMGLCGIVFVVFRGPLIGLFIEDGTPPAAASEIVRLGSMMLIATAAFQLFDAGAMVTSGALRGAGDTFFPGVATVIASWGIIVLGGLFMIRQFPSLESISPWIAAATYIFSLCVLLVGRFLTGKWRKIKLLDRTPAEPTQAAASTTDGL